MTDSDADLSSDSNETPDGTLLEALHLDVVAESPLLSRGLAVLAVLILAVVVYQLLKRMLRLASRRNRGVAEFEFAMLRLLRWGYVPLAALAVLQAAGVAVGNLWTLLSAGLAMVAIGFFAVWSVLSNVSATFMVFSTRLFRIGDEVELLEPTAKEGLRGRVEDITIMSTTIAERDADGRVRSVVKVPNNIFFQKALRIHDGDALGQPEDAEGAGKPESPAASLTYPDRTQRDL